MSTSSKRTQQQAKLIGQQAMVLLVYDVACPKRLRKVAKTCEAYGERVQLSVFELFVDAQQLMELQGKLRKVLDPRVDRVRYYSLCGHDQADIRVSGPATITQAHRYTVV